MTQQPQPQIVPPPQDQMVLQPQIVPQPQDQMVLLGVNAEKAIIGFLWKKLGIILGVLGLVNIGAW